MILFLVSCKLKYILENTLIFDIQNFWMLEINSSKPFFIYPCFYIMSLMDYMQNVLYFTRLTNSLIEKEIFYYFVYALFSVAIHSQFVKENMRKKVLV